MTAIRRGRSDASIFTGTMADVSFLLVIFFMITAAFSISKGIDFSCDEPPPIDHVYEPWEAVDVLVQTDGSILVDGESLILDQLLPYVWSKLEQDAEKPVILRGERDTTYGAVISVLDELRQSSDKMNFDIPNLAMPTFREQHDYSLTFAR
ncbi:MAG: biopolymer transporter ExbD [Thermoanaerobaculales bacterium]|jgi:biopolymer transport protein ExbD|nr:biopolymer transporter ExbD [Thermoanaerobaculales bacterium]